MVQFWPNSHENPDSFLLNRSEQVRFSRLQDGQFYCGPIGHLHCDGLMTINFHDGNKERIIINDEIWRFYDTTEDGSACSALISNLNLYSNVHNQDNIREVLKEFEVIFCK